MSKPDTTGWTRFELADNSYHYVKNALSLCKRFIVAGDLKKEIPHGRDICEKCAIGFVELIEGVKAND